MDFALTGTDISIIITYNSLCQLGEPFKELTMRYICRLPRISYNHRDTARNGCFSLRKLCKDFGSYSGLVLALKEIIANPRWINAWVELLFAGVGTWFYVTNVCMVERTREQLKYTYLHLFVNRQSKNSLADVVLLTQIRNHGGTTGCNFDIFGLCL